MNRTGIKIKYGEPFPNYSNFSKTVGNNDTLFFPIMKQEDDEEECFIPVMKTFGPAYLIRIEKIVPLALLGKGLLQGWQVIALTIVLAAISGIFIWLMVSMFKIFLQLIYKSIHLLIYLFNILIC